MPETTRLSEAGGGAVGRGQSADAAQLTHTVSTEDAGQRVDKLLAGRFPSLSRSRIQALIDAGAVRVDEATVRASHKVSPGEAVRISLPDPAPTTPIAEHIPLKVIYEDDDLLVVDKPAGLVVHPAPGHASGTLVNALLAHAPGIASLDGDDRPGIVHRLDKDTSGLMVVAKHDRAQQFLAAQLRDRQMDKRYLALVDGVPPSESGTIDAPVGRNLRHPRQMAVVASGRAAVTHFRVLHRYDRHTLLECKPVTGRTHQIRVHLASIGCPVAGDRAYGRAPPTLALTRQFLHAARLTFRLSDGAERTFEAPLPPELQEVLTRLAT